MPIRDITKTPFVNDNNENVYIGIDMPFHLGSAEGWFASTSTTIDAVKVNIVNLLKTHTGERLMQPTLGLQLREFLFENMGVENIVNIQNSILDTLSVWLPFVEVRDIQINDNEHNLNLYTIKILFNITQDPNTTESVSLSVDTSESGDGE